MSAIHRIAAAALAAISLAACSHLPELPDMTPMASPAPDAAPRERVRAAIELLDRGDERRARAELAATLEAQPGNVTAQRLMQQIEADPRELLGRESRPYVVRQGETMSQLAERFLGDPLLFYALSRYNGLAAPNQLAAGQTLMIPRRAVAAAAPPAALRTEDAPVDVAAAATPAAVDPARANRLRLRALQQLNVGQVDSAVALLRQAQQLDAGNAAIQRDLDRALRLQASLRGGAGGAN